MTSSPRISVNLEMNPKPILVELNNSDPSQKYRPEISDKEELEMVDKKQIKAVDTQLKNSKINGYFGGLKILTLLCEDGVPFASKILIISAASTVFTSFLLYTVEVDIFSNSICPEKQYLAAFIYIDLLILIPIMLFALSLFNMELINKTPYDFKFTFLRPWLLWGICPIFEMPLMVFDHYNCKMQSPLYSYPESYSIMNAFGILFLIIFGIFVGFLTCLMSNLNCAGLMNCFKKTLLNFIGPAILIVLNMLAFLLTFTQIQFYLPVLYFHNYSYYLMLIMMIIFYVLLFGCKMQGKFHIDEKIVEFSKVIN